MPENEIAAFEQQSYADRPVDYNDLIQEDVFKGEYSPEVIHEGLEDQFTNYLTTEDTTNYVDAFFNEYHTSLDIINQLDADDHPQERKEILQKILETFISFIGDLFENRLYIQIDAIETGSTFDDEMESIIRKLYEFFILNAKNNFIKVISGDIVQKLPQGITDDRQFNKTISSMLMEYNPLIITIDPPTFLKLCGEDYLLESMDDGKWNGNFLRKYSPKIYQNEDLGIDIVTNTAILYGLKEENHG